MTDFIRLCQRAAVVDSDRHIDVETSPEERASIAKRLDLEAVDDFRASVSLRSVGEDILVDGHLNAELKRQCVVSLQPMVEVIDESFALRLTPTLPEPGTEEDESLMEEDRDIDLLKDSDIDIGELLVQQAALAMAAHPKLQGATLNDGPGTRSQDVDKKASPFASLQDLIDRTSETGV